jgi:hypothetical protein
MGCMDLTHPDILRTMRNGRPSQPEIECPVCGAKDVYTFYKVDGDIVGCNECVVEVDAWEE